MTKIKKKGKHILGIYVTYSKRKWWVTGYVLLLALFLKKRMALVASCPKNRTEVEEAGRRLGCGQDKYGNNQYMCLPNVEKTSLVEFCYDQLMGIVPPGIFFYNS